MSQLLAKVMFCGDDHLSCKNYGGHRDYASESMYYADKQYEIAVNEGITHIIHTGDLTYGRFSNLEYRVKIDEMFSRLNSLTNGNFWIVKGNHDKESSGKTEYEYYAERGAFKTDKTIDIGIGTPGGGLHIELKDYGDKSAFTPIQGAMNLIVGHGLYSSENDGMNTFGNPNIKLDHFEPWAGVDMIIAGHIHSEHLVRANICGKSVPVHYLPCLSRPAYIRDGMDTEGTYDIISVFDDHVDIEQYKIELLPLDVSFDVEAIKRSDAARESKEETKIDVADIARKMEEHVQQANDPLYTVEHLEDIDDNVKEIAANLLKAAANLAKK